LESITTVPGLVVGGLGTLIGILAKVIALPLASLAAVPKLSGVAPDAAT
jgi:hypothetical protein